MLKIAVFGFYGQDWQRPPAHEGAQHVSPATTEDFMRLVWEIEPAASRIGSKPDLLRVIKLTRVTTQPVYVQALNDRMARGVALLNCDGYIAIIDAVKVLAPRTIQAALRRLYERHPSADVIVVAARQNEPDALPADAIRDILGLHPDLPLLPYTPNDPESVSRIIRRMVRYIENPDRRPPSIFAGDVPPAAAGAAPQGSTQTEARPAVPRIHGLDHVALTVSDLDRALAFYRGLLGFRVLGHLDFPHDPRGFTITYLDTGRGMIELFSFTQASTQPPGWQADDLQAGMRHLALRVTGLDSIAATLRDAGVPFTMPPTDANGGVRIAFFTDPDGTLIELIEGDLVYSRR